MNIKVVELKDKTLVEGRVKQEVEYRHDEYSVLEIFSNKHIIYIDY